MKFDRHHPIIEDLIEYGGRNNIEVVFSDELHPETPDIVYIKKRLVIINLNSSLKEILPFRISHEFGHVLEQAEGGSTWATFENYDSNNIYERLANTRGIKILLDQHFGTGGQFNYIDFMNMYGLPAWTEEKVKAEMENLYY